MANAHATLEAAGRGVIRSALAGSLLWVGALKFADYEAENIQPMVSTSPLFSWVNGRMGAQDRQAHRGHGDSPWALRSPQGRSRRGYRRSVASGPSQCS